eukprot:CAMPEP_0175882786 /NCGR_PEP_ID=MMETSP0107_2-20121207/43609_1 /TAXON_ID=195067 ORGANISM="Goniomonas pacifica, Strain CCMP1869" /NCGR_SAMPLE_ID=MMETSP0107_2 /ASSEMBLY_ACC=CAM_ASM_000203 /LENGTH=47 /DNA_ID= /DNA_START= /DNA_END= /DNA_ORIENTATION=
MRKNVEPTRGRKENPVQRADILARFVENPFVRKDVAESTAAILFIGK